MEVRVLGATLQEVALEEEGNNEDVLVQLTAAVGSYFLPAGEM